MATMGSRIRQYRGSTSTLVNIHVELRPLMRRLMYLVVTNGGTPYILGPGLKVTKCTLTIKSSIFKGSMTINVSVLVAEALYELSESKEYLIIEKGLF